jgi:hypothetical protein
MPYDLARRMARLRSAKGHFECNRRFLDINFTKASKDHFARIIPPSGKPRHSVWAPFAKAFSAKKPNRASKTY